MSGDALSPTGTHVNSQPPAKRQRLSEVPNDQPYTNLISSKSPEDQIPVPYIENVDLDCRQDLNCKSIRDDDGFNRTRPKQNSTGSSCSHDELFGTISSSNFEELGSACLPGETLTQFRPDTRLSNSPTPEPWSTYFESNLFSDSDNMLSIADDHLSHNENAFEENLQHQVTTSASGAEMGIDLDRDAHTAENLAVTSELNGSVGDGDERNVCFGMIPNIKATYDRPSSGELPESFSVSLDSSTRFSSKEYNFIRGHIQPEHSQMLQGLLEEESLVIHIVCIIGDRAPSKKRARSVTLQPCTLELSVYGPKDLFDDIGSWFQDYEIYLQDPRICHLEAKYCNPQRLSSDNLSASPLVSEVVTRTLVLMPKEVPELHDFLELLSSHVDLEETPQPSAIRATLKSHQKQALTFMLNREEGWGFNTKHPDVWETLDTDHGRMFLNTISHASQPEEPPSFYGGIIADPMGLGKTLTMISLVATDLNATRGKIIHVENEESDRRDVSATLVIIPPPLLSAWEEQLSDHVVDGALVFRRHHGKTRLGNTDEIDSLNLVLTTYHTVSAEWKAEKISGKSPLFSVRWRRIILDEAHFIRNGNCRMSRAVCALDSISRWAVTGTPIQNRLGDLSSLLKFIRAHPYTDQKRFDMDISRLWKSGEDEEAVKRLKRLSACLLLRRPKSTINLPPRRDMVYEVDFTPEEKVVYEQLRQQTITKIDEALGNQLGPSKSRIYVNVLQQIESLRLFSNLGLHYHSRHDKQPLQSSEPEDWARIAQRTFNSQRDMTSVTCLQCSSALGLTDALLDDATPSTASAQFTSCLRYICHDCVDKINQGGYPIECGHSPPCFSSAVSTSTIALEEVGNLDAPQIRLSSVSLPSKIRTLIEDIRRAPADVKCIVFSTWRLTLDLIKIGLDQAEISSIRFDGKVPQKDRQSVINKFKSDVNVRVMLLTLSCGALGLTLVAASRAYLMEPHWNPTLEEQALARIHRLGQTQEVTTVRLYMRESFEEQVMRLQESKKQLASVLLSTDDSGQSGSSQAALERLRSLL